jgi:hypothetical protein
VVAPWVSTTRRVRSPGRFPTTGAPLAVAGRGKGRPEAHTAGTRSALPATETGGRLPPGGRRHLQHRHGVPRRRGLTHGCSCSRTSGQHSVSRMSVKGRRQHSSARHNTAGQSRNKRPEPRSGPRLDRFPKPCVAGSNPAGGTSGTAVRRTDALGALAGNRRPERAQSARAAFMRSSASSGGSPVLS